MDRKKKFREMLMNGDVLADASGTDGLLVAQAKKSSARLAELDAEMVRLLERRQELLAEIADEKAGLSVVDALFVVHEETLGGTIDKAIEADRAKSDEEALARRMALLSTDENDAIVDAEARAQ